MSDDDDSDIWSDSLSSFSYDLDEYSYYKTNRLYSQDVSQWNLLEKQCFQWYACDKLTDQYWIIRGFQTLHGVADREQCLERVKRINPCDRFSYVACRDRDGETALHDAAWRNQLEVAETLIESVNEEDRDDLIETADDYQQTTLHWTKSAEIVNLLVTSLSRERRFQFIQHRDNINRTAYHWAVIEGRHDAMTAIWEQVHGMEEESFGTDAERNFLASILTEGYVTSRETVRVLINHLARSDYFMEVISSVNVSGNTAVHNLIACQWTSEVVNILQALAISERQKLLAIRNHKQYSIHELALTSPLAIKNSKSKYLGIYSLPYDEYLGEQEINTDLVRLLHYLSNEYDMTLEASIIHVDYTSEERGVLTHLHRPSDAGKALVM